MLRRDLKPGDVILGGRLSMWLIIGVKHHEQGDVTLTYLRPGGAGWVATRMEGSHHMYEGSLTLMRKHDDEAG